MLKIKEDLENDKRSEQRLCTRKMSKDIPRLKKVKNVIKRSKNETEKSDKSLRGYIKQKCVWVTFLFGIYIIIFDVLNVYSRI